MLRHEEPIIMRTDELEIVVYPETEMVSFFKLAISEGVVIRGKHRFTLKKKSFKKHKHIWNRLVGFLDIWCNTGY